MRVRKTGPALKVPVPVTDAVEAATSITSTSCRYSGSCVVDSTSFRTMKVRTCRTPGR